MIYSSYTSVQAFLDNNGGFIVELWGKGSIITPAGNRRDGQEFQQKSVIEPDGQGGFTWYVTRWVFEESHDLERATTFQVAGLEDDVAGYRRI